MKVLIVDGSKAERARLVDAFCELTNVVVIGAVARLHTALHALGQSSPDVVVTDTRLGDDEDAASLVAAARRSACPPGIIVYASDASVVDRERCLDAGADRFVAKQSGFYALQQAVFEVGLSRQISMRTLPERAFVARVAPGIAHDLSNQLTVVDAALGLVAKQYGTARPPSELVLARRALEGALVLAQALSRHSHRSTSPPIRLDLASLVKQTIDLFARSLPMNVETMLAADRVPAIVATEREIEQLVMNLVLDACDNMPNGGVITIRVHAPSQRHVQLVVAHPGAEAVHVDFEPATASG